MRPKLFALLFAVVIVFLAGAKAYWKYQYLTTVILPEPMPPFTSVVYADTIQPIGPPPEKPPERPHVDDDFLLFHRPVACGDPRTKLPEDLSGIRGWVLLGLADKSEYRWVTAIGFKTTNYEDGLPMYYEGPPCWLMEGDHIRLTKPDNLLILDFAKFGKENLWVSPATREKLTGDDWITPALSEGTKLVVDKIEIARLGPKGLKAVWAFVHVLENPPES